MKQGFELKETYNEFIFTTGIYNYFREGYPDEHPALKPLVWPFHKGNKELGIQQLKKAFNECIFTKMEALMYLADIYLNYEKKPNEAIKYSTKLVTISPGNLLYKAYHVNTLIQTKNYQKAIPHIQKLLKSTHPPYKYIGHIFQGVLEHRYHKNEKKAEEHYLVVDNLPTNTKNRLTEYIHYVYSGLENIYETKDKSKASEYRKKLKEVN